uniref:PGG domain-containing protein n=1 Tax=Fagus sylvatica TaxID=28930 RepID=A0A2N9HCF6_FAGSY
MASSTSLEADQASGQLREFKIGMDPDYYNAAEKGEIGIFKDIKEDIEKALNLILRTPNRNTVLHVYLTAFNKESESSSPTDFVNEILEMCPSLLWQANTKGETPLHIASRYGHASMVEVLIKHAGPPQEDPESGVTTIVKEMLEMPNKEKDTALHEASCTSPAHGGPLGRTTLHAAVIWEDKEGVAKFALNVEDESVWLEDIPSPVRAVAHANAHVDVEALRVILDRSSFNHLLNEKDVDGSTPLHHHSKSSQYLKDLMCHDRVDKMAFNKENLDAYGIALTNSELSDQKVGWRRIPPNEIGAASAIAGSRKFIFLAQTLMMLPLWLRATAAIHAASGSEEIEMTLFECGHFGRFRRSFIDDKIELEKKVYSLPSIWYLKRADFVSMMQNASTVYLVVDGLIATVTFAAGITMPGGFIGIEGPHQGSAVLTRNTAFRAFVITDTIAMVQSCSAAFISLFMPLLFHEKDPGDFSFLLASMAFCLTISAMGATVLAFVTAHTLF